MTALRSRNHRSIPRLLRLSGLTFLLVAQPAWAQAPPLPTDSAPSTGEAAPAPQPVPAGSVTTATAGAEATATTARGPSYLNATLEVASVMAIGLGIYISKGDRNAYDWPLTWSRIEQRFTTLDHFRFDDNEFAMNNVSHPAAGALYYRFARSNGFGPLASSIYSLAGSTFWEVIVELREIASLNDLIATPASGIALGEALHQHTRFYRRGAPRLRNSVLEKAFSGPILINRLFGEPEPLRADTLTPAGLPADRPHRMRVSLLAAGRITAARSAGTAPPRAGRLVTLGAVSEIASVDPGDGGGYRETGGLPLTRLELNVGLLDAVPAELHVGAETVFGGWRGGRLERGASATAGARWLVSPATAFTMRLDHTRDTRWMELLSTAHVLGLRLDGVLRQGPLRVRWNGGVYGDFSSVRPLAIYAFRSAGEPLPAAHSVLVRNQYYYAYGATLRSRLELDAGPVSLRAELDHHTLAPFQGPHRNETVPGSAALPLGDTRTYGRAWLETRPRSGVVIGAGVDARRAWGRMGSTESRDRETRLLLVLTGIPW